MSERRAPYAPEAGFQRAVVHYALLTGWRVFHDEDPRRDEAGWPDLILVRPPWVVFVELKTETGQPSGEQCELLELLQACDQVACRLWRPSDWESIADMLR